MDWRFFEILKRKYYQWKQEILLATKIFFTLLGYAAAGQEGAYFAMIGNCVATVGRSIVTRGSGLIATEK